jgi:hypothetical protein
VLQTAGMAFLDSSSTASSNPNPISFFVGNSTRTQIHNAPCCFRHT